MYCTLYVMFTIIYNHVYYHFRTLRTIAYRRKAIDQRPWPMNDLVVLKFLSESVSPSINMVETTTPYLYTTSRSVL